MFVLLYSNICCLVVVISRSGNILFFHESLISVMSCRKADAAPSLYLVTPT